MWITVHYPKKFGMERITPGYSGTPLLKKLGIKPHMKVLLISAPEAYDSWLQADIRNQLVSKGQVPDLVHIFASDKAAFLKSMPTILAQSRANTQLIIWVSWYKKTAGIPSDLSENTIREFALANGLVDVKVCAVSDQWSGLKLVVPLALR
jgi:hypothetical protein